MRDSHTKVSHNDSKARLMVADSEGQEHEVSCYDGKARQMGADRTDTRKCPIMTAKQE